ncbi:MAG: NmrA family NAD(P)-binding protein [Acidobacteriota bacterium]
MPAQRVLVVGASGQLGSVITMKLLAAGISVRALARHVEKLQPFAAAGAEIAAVDLLDLVNTSGACRGITDIIATANNNMGHGATSPLRVDVTAYQNLCAAARQTGVERITYVSFRGATPTVDVDIFRLKWHIADVIKRSQIPYVIMQPTAFMDVWIDQLIAGGIRKNGVTMLFGDGSAVANYISVDDVAEFALKILQQRDLVNEVVDLGGPSNISFNDLATLVERRLSASGKRRHMPVFVMKVLRSIVKPFSESAARLISLGHFAATQSKPFPDWKTAADRFGVHPETVEMYISRHLAPSRTAQS